jgi:hypothetical protein
VINLLKDNFRIDVLNMKTNNLWELKDGRLILSSNKIDIKELRQYSRVITSPINPTLSFLKENKNSNIKVIALLNDCYTYVLWRNLYVSYRIRDIKFKDFFQLLKIPFFYFKELKISRNADVVILQTLKDISVFSKLFKGNAKLLAVPNSPTFYEVNEKRILKGHRAGVGFVASFVGSYKRVAIWYIKNVWREVIKIDKNQKLYLLGKGNKAFVEEMINRFPELNTSLISNEYVKDISSFYLKIDKIVSPIFKGYGLINKTVEAMYFGCIVIGDNAAFNGIGKTEKEAYVLAENPKEFINAITDFNRKDESIIRLNAHHIIKSTFDSKTLSSNLLKFIK